MLVVIACGCGSSPDDVSDESSSGPGTTSSASASSDEAGSLDASSSSSAGGSSSSSGTSSGTTGELGACGCGVDEICVEAQTDGCIDPHVPSTTCVAMPDACAGVDPACDSECGWEICAGPLCGGAGAEVCNTPSDGFVCGGFTFTCNLFASDCAAGEKCTSWDSDADGKYDNTRCSPIASPAVAVGEACTSEASHLSGIDDCEAGAMCLSDDPTETAGTCRAACEGNPYAASCADAGTECMLDSWFFGWCLPT
jgi:hypothetical protein